MNISTKRVYDDVQKDDGFRVLVDRLWPRGISKTKAAIELWAKDISPSTSLRKWFHQDIPARFEEFSKRYRAELMQTGAFVDFQTKLSDKQRVTLVSAVKDLEHSHVAVLMEALQEKT